MNQQIQQSRIGTPLWIGLALLAVLVATSALLAQARVDVGTLMVRYRAQKRIKQPDGELLKALEALEQQALAYYSRGKTGEIRRLLGKGLRLLNGKEWNQQTDFLNSLTLRTDMTVCDPNKRLIGRVAQVYPSDYDNTNRLKIRVSLAEPTRRRRQLGAGKILMDLGVFSPLPRDLLDTPFAFEVDIADAGEGVFALSVEVTDGDTVIHRMATPLYVVRDLDSKRIDFTTRLNAISDSEGTKASIRYPFQLASLVNLGRVQPRFTYDWISMLQEAESLLNSFEEGEDPLKGAVGDTRRHYYLDEADEIIPYRLYVPSSYDGSTPFPLIVVLHGLGGTENTFFERGAGLLPSLCEQHGYILAAPMGYRVNGGYGRGKNSPLAERRRLSELSEKDVMSVLSLVRNEYLIDGHRIYLTGHSMGGNGTWHLAAEYPDLWAAIAPCASGSVTPDNIDISSIQRLPVLVIHGDADMVAPVTASRSMVAKMMELGMEYEYIEVPGGTHNSVVNSNLPKVVEFFNRHRKE